MPKDLPVDYFYRGVWRSDSEGPELRHFTCVPCGHRAKTWGAFKAHRAECLGYPTGNAPRRTLAEALGLDTESGNVV